MLELFGMMRPLNGVMALVGVLIGGLIALGGGVQSLYVPNFFLALAAVFIVNGAGNVFNDYADVEADRVNKPGKPIPSGKVSGRSALIFSVALFVIGNVLALMINGLCFTIALINTFILIAYSLSLQHKVLLGNFAIGYLVGSVFLFGGAVFLEMKLVFILMLLAMLSTVAREIVKDLEDVEGDKKGFLKKIASKVSEKAAPIAERFGITTEGVRMKYQERTMLIIAIACMVTAIALSMLPYYHGILRMSYLAIVAVADLIFISCIYSLVKDRKRKKYRNVSKRLKMGMFVALLAFIAGIFF